jgi:hypothetical protein
MWGDPCCANRLLLLHAPDAVLLPSPLLAGQQQQQAGTQQRAGSDAGAGSAAGGVPQALLQRDLRRLAQDVFKQGDTLAGGRCALRAAARACWQQQLWRCAHACACARARVCV